MASLRKNKKTNHSAAKKTFGTINLNYSQQKGSVCEEASFSIGLLWRLELISDGCNGGVDRRERAQLELRTRFDTPSQNISRLCPLISDEAMVLGNGWQVEASRTIWLGGTCVVLCKKLNCFFPSAL
ncbi:hypothetical protein U1Q18_007054 [Sarracenia purpurea var. burkii]